MTRRLIVVALLAATASSASPIAAATVVDVVRLAPVVTDGVPRALVTVVVPMPAELGDAPDVTYRVRVKGGIELLGRLAGVARTRSGVARPLILTVRVPANVDAGILEAADVSFRAGEQEFVVPLHLRIIVVRALALTGPSEMRGLRIGDRAEVSYTIMNGGNAPDTLRIGVQAPPGWVARLDRASVLVLAPRAQQEFSVSLGIPLGANVGDYALAVILRDVSGVSAKATAFTTIGVAGRAASTPGLVLRSTVATAVSSDGTATFTGLEVDGPIGGDLFIRARLAPALSGSGMTVQGLSAVGATGAPFSATLAGPDWDVALGNTALQLSDLTGVNLLGRGVTGQLKNGVREFRAIGARPAIGDRVDGQLVGAGYWQETAAGRFGSSASYLAERGAALRGRDLTAFAADYRTRPLGTVTLGAALAHRSSDAAEGIGYSASAVHVREADRLALRVTHAPGGSAAYARATDEWSFEASRVLSPRWNVDAAAQRSRDAGPVFANMDVLFWSLGQRLVLARGTAATLRTQSSDFDARTVTGGIGGFGAADRRLTAGLEWRRSLLTLSAEGSFGEVSRTTELFGGRVSETSARQRGLRLTLARVFEFRGGIDLHAGVEETAAGVGIPRQVLNAGARWSDLPIAFGTRQARLNLESNVQRLGDQPAALVSRASMRTALPLGLDFVVSAERNPFFRDARGRAGWIVAMRLTAATRVYSPSVLGPEGSVYEDLDQNGRRDPGEPGVVGVMVRRGESRATTDGEGRYRLALAARGRTRIDQGTLPIGLVAHPLLAADSLERLDLPVLPTGQAVFELVLTADDQGRVPNVDLQPAVVVLVDQSGFAWVGRRTSKTTAVFDGIPTGQYTLQVNFTQVREPLRIEGERNVEIRAHRTTTLRVPVHGRLVRIFTPSPRASQPSPSTPEQP